MSNIQLPVNYSQTFLEIKERINHARYLSLRFVNKELINAYLEIGKVISQRVTNGWGASVVDRLSLDLQTEFPGVTGFSARNHRRMRLIYDMIIGNPIWPQLVAKLPWGHPTARRYSAIFT